MTRILADTRAKERILLSTALVTMLLSACFLSFIVWLLCYLACSRRNKSLSPTNKEPKATKSSDDKDLNQELIDKALVRVELDDRNETQNCFKMCSGNSINVFALIIWHVFFSLRPLFFFWINSLCEYNINESIYIYILLE